MRQHLARKIIKMSEEDFLPSTLKTHIKIMKIVSAIAVFICGPIMGWLYTEMNSGTLSIGLFIVFVFPMLFLALLTGIALTIKTPE